jgi:ketosteroid isomerase-like protein
MDGALELARTLLQRLSSTEVNTSGLLAPEVEWYASVGGLEPRRLRGRNRVLAGFQDYSGTWEGLHFEGGAVVIDGDRAFVFATEHARGSGSGVEVEQLTAMILTTASGRITEIVTYLDLLQGYRDFGLDPDDVPGLEAGKAYELRDGHAVPVGE